jgi:hypothetical protein
LDVEIEVSQFTELHLKNREPRRIQNLFKCMLNLEDSFGSALRGIKNGVDLGRTTWVFIKKTGDPIKDFFRLQLRHGFHRDVVRVFRGK